MFQALAGEIAFAIEQCAFLILLLDQDCKFLNIDLKTAKGPNIEDRSSKRLRSVLPCRSDPSLKAWYHAIISVERPSG